MRCMNATMMFLTRILPFCKKFLKILKEQMVKPTQSITENR